MAMKNLMQKTILLSCATLILSLPAFAKDMQSRLGIGYSNQFSVELPGVKVKYYPSKDFAVSMAVGSDTISGGSKFGVMARGYRNIFTEENLNFYGGAGAGILSTEDSGRNNSGFEINGFFGCEFFLPGLESLGISFEAGLGIASVTAGVRFRTMADHPLRAGMVFYF